MKYFTGILDFFQSDKKILEKRTDKSVSALKCPVTGVRFCISRYFETKISANKK